MIIIRLKGGLGNQLFQYALGRRFTAQGKDVMYDITTGYTGQSLRHYNLDHYKVQVIPAPIEKIKEGEAAEYKRTTYGIISKSMRYLKAKSLLKTDGIISKTSNLVKSILPNTYNIGYVGHILETKDGYLDGFWQSHKYIDPIRGILLKEIDLKEPIENRYPDLITKIKETNSISLHIRRGDYVNDPTTKQVHMTFGIEYYDTALKIIREKVKNPVIFVFSDDILWARDNLKTDIPMIFVSADKTKKSDTQIPDYEELMIMSTCKHNIIANSSFSFWSAWLNQNEDKIVIAPSKWSNCYQKELQNLAPPTWIKI